MAPFYCCDYRYGIFNLFVNLGGILFNCIYFEIFGCYLVGDGWLSNLKQGVLNFTITCYVINDFGAEINNGRVCLIIDFIG
jgi:hypothetical protein